MSAARVLVIDDDQLHLTVLSCVLRRAGYDVLPAFGPRQALGIIRNESSIDVILSDVNMPEMRGTELVREAAQISPQTASLLMSGEDIGSAEVPPGVAVLKKPITKQDLLAAVQAACELSVQLGEKVASAIEHSAELERRSRKLRSDTEEVMMRARETLRQFS
jgi:DNA-binding NtrC family response regulator